MIYYDIIKKWKVEKHAAERYNSSGIADLL